MTRQGDKQPGAAWNQSGSSRTLLPGEFVVLATMPEGLLDGLPAEDQAAIAAIIGKPVRLVEIDERGKAQLDFTEPDGTMHSIWVDADLVEPAPNGARR